MKDSHPPMNRYWIPWFIFFIGLVTSIFVTILLWRLSDSKDLERFNNDIEQTQQAIWTRFENYIAILRGTRGFIVVEGDLTREKFKTYVDMLQIPLRYPGVQGVGFAKHTYPEEIPELIAFMQSQGNENFNIWPAGEREVYYPIIFLEPMDLRNQAAIGYDMFEEPVRHAAMARARDMGSSAMTGKVKLVQEIDEEIQAGFLIYVPIYQNSPFPASVEERRKEIIGFAYSPFRINDLLQGILDNRKNLPLVFKIYDGHELFPEHLMYQSERFDQLIDGGYAKNFTQSRVLEIGGHIWTVLYTPSINFNYASGREIVPYVFIVSLILTSLLTGVVWSQIKARAETERNARDLYLSQEKLKALNETLEQRVVERTLDVNQRADQLRLMASELTLAEQRERRRLATELHDYLAQILVVCRMKLSRLKNAENHEQEIKIIHEMDEMLNQSLQYTRTLIADLSPSILYESGFLAAVNWLASQMEQHGLHVKVHHPAQNEIALKDDQKILLFQAVREILMNVVKHSGVNAAEIKILREDNLFLVSIMDQGKGFDVTSVRRDATQPGKFGLFSIYERLKALGGTVKIESGENEGTHVRLEIPLLNPESSLVDEKERGEPVEQKHVIRTDGNMVRILIADDHDMVREGLVHIINSCQGVKVIGGARNGVEAVEMARKFQPDAIVMDLNMPLMNGIEATRRIKKEMTEITIIGLSVHRDQDMAAAMKEAGATAYLIKGESPEELCNVINSLTKQADAQQVY